MREHSLTILAIAIGAICGTLLRYAMYINITTAAFPLDTLLENLLGSFILGALTAYFLFKNFPTWLKAGLGIGFCGGFTTMSTLAQDAVTLLQQGEMFIFLSYILLSAAGGIALAFFGYKIVENKLAPKEETN
ncbi:fluoride efflux transporter FluC [Halalkalibacillus halophilus]|uniref:fluoride efflux transporter FluC n=1 Tax=Halalkalibacillus halophilus TaxID=392827 RepID=UPI0004028495|nr:CrcB family protein [Halalkalibacillus halophilus]